jgi:hypothetical protein
MSLTNSLVLVLVLGRSVLVLENKILEILDELYFIKIFYDFLLSKVVQKSKTFFSTDRIFSS